MHSFEQALNQAIALRQAMSNNEGFASSVHLEALKWVKQIWEGSTEYAVAMQNLSESVDDLDDGNGEIE